MARFYATDELRKLHARRKTWNTEEYYMKRWDEFLNNRPDASAHWIASCYMNLEENLEKYVSTMHGVLTPEQLEFVKRSFAPEVAAKAYAQLKENQKTVRQVINGEAHIDMEFNQYRERFEFNCIQLREFKKKYGVK